LFPVSIKTDSASCDHGSGHTIGIGAHEAAFACDRARQADPARRDASKVERNRTYLIRRRYDKIDGCGFV
jgi:hypothetical protein